MMMKVTVKDINQVGPCNYCDKSELREDGLGLEYPYNKVILLEGNYMVTRFCKNCFKELMEYKSILKEV